MKTTYEITCGPNERTYVGCSVRPKRRWAEHKYRLRRNAHWIGELQADWNQYGEDAFSFSALPSYGEQERIDAIPEHLRYNRRLDAASNAGFRHSEDTKARLRRTMRGRDVLTKEKRQQAAAKLRGQKKPKHVIQASQAGLKRWRSTPAAIQQMRWRFRKLSDKQVRAIRLNPGRLTYRDLGEMYGVTATVICRIRQRKSYAEID